MTANHGMSHGLGRNLKNAGLNVNDVASNLLGQNPVLRRQRKMAGKMAGNGWING